MQRRLSMLFFSTTCQCSVPFEIIANCGEDRAKEVNRSSLYRITIPCREPPKGPGPWYSFPLIQNAGSIHRPTSAPSLKSLRNEGVLKQIQNIGIRVMSYALSHFNETDASHHPSRTRSPLKTCAWTSYPAGTGPRRTCDGCCRPCHHDLPPSLARVATTTRRPMSCASRHLRRRRPRCRPHRHLEIWEARRPISSPSPSRRASRGTSRRSSCRCGRPWTRASSRWSPCGAGTGWGAPWRRPTRRSGACGPWATRPPRRGRGCRAQS